MDINNFMLPTNIGWDDQKFMPYPNNKRWANVIVLDKQ